jgi:hypothetical protein
MNARQIIHIFSGVGGMSDEMKRRTGNSVALFLTLEFGKLASQ